MSELKLNINQSIDWLNKNSSENFSRSRFYRLRKKSVFAGFWRKDKQVYYFTPKSLKRGCNNIGVTTKEVANA